MNKYQEALNNIRFYCGNANCDEYLNPKVFEELNIIQELVDKEKSKKNKIEQQNDYVEYSTLDEENFDLKQKLNTEEECCAMLKKKVKTQAEIIKSLAKALEDNEIDLSYLIFSYLTPEEYVYIREILPYSISLYTRSDEDE